MKRIHRNVIAVSFAFLLAVAGFTTTASAEDWQPISKDDLALKDNPASPGAHAMILYRESDVDTNEASIFEYVRIKIFTEEGKKKWGDVEIPLFKLEGGYDIHDIRARTIRPDGTIVNFDGKVYEKEIYKGSLGKVLAKTFSLPDVQPGCIIEYKYREQHDKQYLVQPTWILQKDLFTRYGKFTFHPSKQEIDYQLFWRYNTPHKTEPKRQSDGSYMMELHDMPGIDEESYMLPRPVLEARLEFFYRASDEPTNETADHYWKRMGKKWNEDFEHFINRKGALESELSQVISPNDPAETKLRKIYARVQKIKNMTFEREKTDKELKAENLKKNDNVEDVLKHGYGTASQINLLFIGLARTAGFEASKVYVAPRSNNFFNEQMEDPSEIDDDVVWVKADNKDVYLDPGDPFYPYGLLPWSETEVKGIRLNKQGGDMVTTTPPDPKDWRRERQADLMLDEDGNLSGKIIVDYFDAAACTRRYEEHEDDDAGKKKDMTDLIRESLPAEASFEITQITGWDNNNAPLHIEGKIHVTGYAATTGRRILAPVTLFRSPEAKAFESAKRVNVIYFHYPYTEHDEIILHVPGGYSVETAPPAVKAPDAQAKIIDYSLTATPQGSIVHIDRRLDVKDILFEAKYYGALRNIFSQVKSDDESQLVFTTAQAAQKK